MSKQNATIGKQYKVKEKFSAKKAVKGLNPFNLVAWSKALSTLYRFIIIGILCFGLTFGYGYWKGLGRSPVQVGYKDFKTYVMGIDGDKHTIEVKNHVLYFDKKPVRVKDIPKLKTYGIHIKPKLFAGLASTRKGEVGLGAEVAYYFKFNLDVFGTPKALYLGVSRDLELDKIGINNSSIGIAVGHGYKVKEKDYRFMVYWSLKF